MENRCVGCGLIIPEGLQVCPKCLRDTKELEEKAIKQANSLMVMPSPA